MKEKPELRERTRENPSLTEIIEPRRVARMVSDQEIEKWYEEISTNPWRTIISEKGVNGP